MIRTGRAFRATSRTMACSRFMAKPGDEEPLADVANIPGSEDRPRKPKRVGMGGEPEPARDRGARSRPPHTADGDGRLERAKATPEALRGRTRRRPSA